MNRIYEKSSGGIVYRKKGDNIEILLLEWLNSKQNPEYVIPKWHIEEWEIARVAALREVSEESWLAIKDLEVIKFITKLNYTFTAWYLEDNPLIDKDVYLFLIKYNWSDEPVVQKEERFVWYKWLTLNELKNIDVRFDINSIIAKNKIYFI